MSPKLPVTTPKKLIKGFQKGGFIIDHQTGSHVSMIHPEKPGLTVTIPFHTKDVSKGLLKAILRQANMSVEELIELL